MAEEIAYEERMKAKFMKIEQRRFEDVELLTASSAADLGKLVRSRVLEGWDIFGGLHAQDGIWVQYVVRYVVRADKRTALPVPG